MDWLAGIFDWLREQEAGFSAVAAILVIAGVAFAGLRWLVQRRSQTAPEAAPQATTETASKEDPLLALPTGPVVAVLPFENLSRDPDQEYFSDGLTDDIITALSRFKDLFVIARNSTFRYKGQAVDVRQLKKELGARYVLEGSVQKGGETLRVTAQLLDAKDGTHLWAETFDRDLSAGSIFAIQDEITEQVVATIAGSYGAIFQSRLAEIKEKRTDHLDAYEGVLQYTAYSKDNFSATNHAIVREGLENAVKTDSNYALAWACLCFVYLDEHLVDYNPRPDPLDRALDAARRAVALDSANQISRFALAYAHFARHDIDIFATEGERAVAMNPNNSPVLATFGDCLEQSGSERGITFVRKAMALDPFHPSWYYFPIAHYHFERGEYQEALAAARRIDLPGLFLTQIFLAAIYADLGRQSEARSAVEVLLELSPGFNIESLIEDRRKWNATDESIGRWVAALRKAGLPE